MQHKSSRDIKNEYFGRAYWGMDMRTQTKPNKKYDRKKEKINIRKVLDEI